MKKVIPAILAALILAACAAPHQPDAIDLERIIQQTGAQPYTQGQRDQWALQWERQTAEANARNRAIIEHADKLLADIKTDCDGECALYLAEHNQVAAPFAGSFEFHDTTLAVK